MTSPLYEDLADDLRSKVLSGLFAPGERLPSEANLGATHGVSRPTVRQALDLLEREGYVYSAKGRGWFVKEIARLVWHASRPERNQDTDIAPNDAWSRDVRQQGHEPDEEREVAKVAASHLIATRLGIEPGSSVYVRRRLRFVDGEPSNTADTYYPREIVEGTPIAEPGDVLPSAYAVLDELGLGWTDEPSDELICRRATVVEADRFGIQVGDPVFDILRTRVAADGRPVAVTSIVAPGDRFRVIYGGKE